MFDVKIINGTLFDGSGKEGVQSNIAIKDGLIAEIGDCQGDAKKVIDATDHIVTPGFVDLHTHYDGQVSWDEKFEPSVYHGVTTVVLGSCGVGFAPCRKEDQQRLINLMEGVEDIPGSALSEGLTWDWESFPEYMDALEKVPHSIDFALQVPHDPVRVYVMGDRAVAEEKASTEDITKMSDLVKEALEAGAAGFSTGRSDVHKSSEGFWTPSSEASLEELRGISAAFHSQKHGVLQIVSDFDLERDPEKFSEEFQYVEELTEASNGHPLSISLVQRDLAANQWEKIIAAAEKAGEKGIEIRFQVAPRGIGIILGYQCTFHPFMGFPSYLKIANLPLEEKIKFLKDPSFKENMLKEKSQKMSGEGSSIPPLADIFLQNIDFVSWKLFRLGNPPDYEQPIENSLGAYAHKNKLNPLELIYDAMLEEDGNSLLYFPIYNYTQGNLDNVYKMMTHPNSLPGLSDGGAHVGTVCDASFPSFFLSHWTKDRTRGPKLGIPKMVEFLTKKPAEFMGLNDRGVLKVGKKADINVINWHKLQLKPPKMHHDLPGGAQRLIQRADGYKATIVSGQVIIEDDQLLSARPGKLVRFPVHKN